MPWYYYLVAVLAAFLLVNGVPHFVNGISGRQFTSPFVGGPPNLDSAVHNVWWGGGNFIVGGLLLWWIRDGLTDGVLVAELVTLGMAAATALAWGFSNPDRARNWRRNRD